KGLGDAYRELYTSLSLFENSPISVSEIKLVSPNSPLAAHAIRIRDRNKGKHLLRLTVQKFAELAAEQVIIYPRARAVDPGGAHRDLIGIDSPPLDHEPDNMALGPVLPDGWD